MLANVDWSNQSFAYTRTHNISFLATTSDSEPSNNQFSAEINTIKLKTGIQTWFLCVFTSLLSSCRSTILWFCPFVGSAPAHIYSFLIYGRFGLSACSSDVNCVSRSICLSLSAGQQFRFSKRWQLFDHLLFTMCDIFVWPLSFWVIGL